MKTKLNYLMMLLAVLMAQMGRAAIVTTTYDFAASVQNGNTTTQFSEETINVGGVSCTFYSTLGNVQNPGRFASQNTGMILRSATSSSGTTRGLCQTGVGTNQYRTFVINNLYAGDVVTINGSTTFSSTSGNATANGNTFTITSKGALGISLAGTQWIYSITIQHDDAGAYAYDPAIEIYDLSGITGGTVSATNDAGYSYTNGYAAKILDSPSGYPLNDRIAVMNTDFTWNNGLQNSRNNAARLISINNLKADDRVIITFQGGATFTSHHMNNSSFSAEGNVFKDDNNDGEQNEGETLITAGTAVESGAVYTMTADGHLDIALGNSAKITKIEIYGDHQATMEDRYNGSAATGYTAYFSQTGQLLAKEHIVPGGLEVHIGNEDNNQHAIVVSSDQGPVSFVYDQGHYKMARQSDNGTFIETAAPATGTFYKFMPEVDGYLTVNFKAYNIKYNNYLNGNGLSQGNEVVATSGTCPYYIMVKDVNNNFSRYTYNNVTQYAHELSTGANDKFENIRVTAGNTYYVYGWWSRDSGGRQAGTNGWKMEESNCGVAQLIDVTFIPDNMVTPLAKWVESGTEEDDDLADVTGYTTSDLHIKKMSNNITNCEPYIHETTVNGQTVKKLGIRNITFADGANPGGTILIKLGSPSNDANPVFAYTIAYDASWNNGQGHTWDFSENPLKGLKWTNKNTEADVVDFGTEAGPGLLHDEMHEANGHSDWTMTYRVKKGDTKYDLMFLNKYDMEGDNADMMWDTEGLIINTSSNQSCINNEHGAAIDHSDKTQADPDRYVGILPGGEFIIPRLKADDRVIIYMGSGYGSGSQTMHFNITNALDAVHNKIVETDDYYAGGSQWNTIDDHNDPYYRGCYHFFAEADGDMKFKLVGGSMCKLYSIQIYRGERINTNGVQEGAKGSGYTLLATKDGGAGETKTWNLHYRGKGETLADGIERNGKTIKNEFIAYSGTITKENTPLTTNSNTISCTNNGVIGMARVRAKCMEYNQKYVTDFADRNLTFAYHEKAPGYPYTWDFTDINGFSSSAITGEYNNYNELQSGDEDYEFEPKGRELSMWDANGKMVIYCSDGSYYQNQNMIFENAKGINGNQLYANGAVIPETKGLWFYFDNNDPAYNGCMQIAADGLHLANASYENGATCEVGVSMRRGWWNYKMVVPDVPSGAAVYLRMARDESVKEGNVTFRPWSTSENDYVNAIEPFFYKKFQFGWMKTKAEIGTEQTDICKYYQASDGTGDYIVAIKNSGETSNLTFTLNGWILKKMSVATDEKTVNKFGWNTESRDHAIDPSLLPYMTGKDFRTYIVTGVSAENKTATLARIDGGSGDDLENTKGKLYVPGATDGSINACIVRYVNEDAAVDAQTVNIFNDNNGFHLFVPDMHDDATARNTSLEGNKLKAQVSNTETSGKKVPRTENGNNNYAFTFKYVKVNGAGDATSDDQKDGVQAFYRIVKDGASSKGNQAYLSIPQVIASSRAAVRAEEAAATPESYTLVFKDWYELEGEKGDVNGDGLVNEADMELTKDYVTERYSQGLFKRMGDMNDDGKVDIVDLTLLIQKIMGE